MADRVGSASADPRRTATLADLVPEAARRAGSNLAVVAPDGALTYAALDGWAGAVALRLRALGVGAGDRVVLWAPKSARLVAAMQACLRLGAAYVPLDPANPAARAATVVEDCRAAAVIADARRLAALAGPQAVTARPFDLAGDWPTAPDRGAPRAAVAPGDLAYILYTSGSSGRPKGVCVSHRAAMAFVDWAVDTFALDPADRLANHAAFSFDLSVLDLHGAFRAGASVHLVPEDLTYAPGRLADVLTSGGITVSYSVPSTLVAMARRGGLLERAAPRSLRAVLFAGEPFPIAVLRAFLRRWPQVRFYNLYGPTETNVCTYYEVTPADAARTDPVPIGRACCGDRVWAVTDGRRARTGEEGELVVDGPTVMLGYWGAGARHGPYHTGDRVRVLPGGMFEFLGRVDETVKVRGHRVALAEVETALSSLPGVAQAAATVTGEAEQTRLVAFLVCDTGRGPSLLSVKRHCAERLPRWMIPDAVERVDDLPRTLRGKLDRAALARARARPPVDGVE